MRKVLLWISVCFSHIRTSLMSLLSSHVCLFLSALCTQSNAYGRVFLTTTTYCEIHLGWDQSWRQWSQWCKIEKRSMIKCIKKCKSNKPVWAERTDTLKSKKYWQNYFSNGVFIICLPALTSHVALPLAGGSHGSKEGLSQSEASGTPVWLRKQRNITWPWLQLHKSCAKKLTGSSNRAKKNQADQHLFNCIRKKRRRKNNRE